MKKRNLVIVAFLLVAAMTLGVGYAALSANLTIYGNAAFHVDAAEDAILEDVFFTAAEVESGTGGSHREHDGQPVVDNPDLNGDLDDEKSAQVTFDVKTLAGIGESVTFIYTIENASSAGVAADLALENTSVNRAHYGVKVQWEDGQTGPKVIQAGTTQKVHVTVTLNNISNTGAVAGQVTEQFTIGILVTMPSTSSGAGTP